LRIKNDIGSEYNSYHHYKAGAEMIY